MIALSNSIQFSCWNVLNTYCVTELYDLAKEEPPADSGHLRETTVDKRWGHSDTASYNPVWANTWNNTSLPSLPAGWCCNLLADRGSCSLRAKMWPGTVKYLCSDLMKHHQHDADDVTKRDDRAATNQIWCSWHLIWLLCTHLMKHVGWQANHGKVVNDENNSQVNRLSVLHQTGGEPHHTEVNKEDEGYGDRRVDQWPWVCPLIWKISHLYL